MQVSHRDLKDGIKGGGYFKEDGSGSPVFMEYKPGDTDFPSDHHGTFCMGMAGARMNNGRGGCGSAPEADLLPIACLEDKITTQITLARAVEYAADHADVVSCSLGPNSATWELEDVLKMAIESAATKRSGLGVPIFWAVSNGNVRIEGDQVCSHPNVIAVGSSNNHDLAGDSAYGPKLEFLAPGEAVFSTCANGQYDFRNGASNAAPLAAGVGALVLSLNDKLTATQVRKRLRATCDKIGGEGVIYVNGRHDRYGYGRINAYNAVR